MGAIETYAQVMNFRTWHRLVFFVASITTGFWFLCPLFFPKPPWWVLAVSAPPILTWLIITLPRHYHALGVLRRQGLYPHKLLQAKYAYLALRPSGRGVGSRLLVALFYLSLAIPITCMVVSIAYWPRTH